MICGPAGVGLIGVEAAIFRRTTPGIETDIRYITCLVRHDYP